MGLGDLNILLIGRKRAPAGAAQWRLQGGGKRNQE